MKTRVPKLPELDIQLASFKDAGRQQQINQVLSKFNIISHEYNEEARYAVESINQIEYQEKLRLQEDAKKALLKRTDFDGDNAYAQKAKKIAKGSEDKRKQIPDKIDEERQKMLDENKQKAQEYADIEREKAYERKLEELNSDTEKQLGKRAEELAKKVDTIETQLTDELYAQREKDVEDSLNQIGEQVDTLYESEPRANTEKKKILTSLEEKRYKALKKQQSLVDELKSNLQSDRHAVEERTKVDEDKEQKAKEFERIAKEKAQSVEEIKRKLEDQKRELKRKEQEIEEREKKVSGQTNPYMGMGQIPSIPGYGMQPFSPAVAQNPNDEKYSKLQEKLDEMAEENKKRRAFWKKAGVAGLITIILGGGGAYAYDQQEQRSEAQEEQMSSMASELKDARVTLKSQKSEISASKVSSRKAASSKSASEEKAQKGQQNASSVTASTAVQEAPQINGNYN